jgi:hypothetical protein
VGHDKGVSAVKSGRGNLGHLCSLSFSIVDHVLKNLRLDHEKLGHLVRLLDSPFLSNYKFLSLEMLPLQLISLEDHAVSFLEDVLIALNSVYGVDLGHDLDVLA